MRDLAGLTVGLIVGATLASVAALIHVRNVRVEQVNMVPISQCLEALLATQPRFKP